MPPAWIVASQADRLPLAAQEFPVDRRQLLDRIPPGVVVGDPVLDTRDQGRRQRDLLAAAPRQRDAEVHDRVALARGAATAGLATAEQAADDTPAQHLREGWQAGDQPASALKQSFHLTSL